MAEETTIGIDTTEDNIAMYEPEKREYDDHEGHVETGTGNTEGTRELTDEEQFRAKDFRTVDDIMNIIDDVKGESPKEGKDEPTEKQEEQVVQEQKNSDPEQSTSSVDIEKTAPAESDEGTQESKPESDKEGNTSTEIELSDRDATIEVDGEKVSVGDIVDEWQNNRDWQKANTERAQEIAEDRKAIDAFKSEEIMALLGDEDFLEAVDDWNDGKENPLRKVAENLKQNTVAESDEPVAVVATESEELARERTELEVDREILDLQTVDGTLKDDAEMERLLQFAVDNKISLYDAHQYKKAGDMERELGTVQDELKERNKELSELKKTSGKPIPSAPMRGQGSKGESLPPNSEGWKGAENRVLHKLGL